MFEKVQFSRSKLSDFAEGIPTKAKRHLERCLFKNGAADKKVRAFHTAHRKRPAHKFAVYLALNISGAAIPD